MDTEEDRVGREVRTLEAVEIMIVKATSSHDQDVVHPAERGQQQSEGKRRERRTR